MSIPKSLQLKIENEWANMPPDDGGPAQEIVRNLRVYNIFFFPATSGYYTIQKIGGICYEIRSSFEDSGKSMKRVLEDIIVDRAMKGHSQK